MKWACLGMLLADLLLFAFAGYRMLTLPPPGKEPKPTAVKPATGAETGTVKLSGTPGKPEVKPAEVPPSTATTTISDKDLEAAKADAEAKAKETPAPPPGDAAEIDGTAEKQEDLDDAKKKIGKLPFGGGEKDEE